ncbi:MAG: TlpA disulfide reductase family protein, partial [Bacteroidales bacterium]|nr:TlpA disulfide reductase family protein [Bacteroidales bacterium]
LTKKARFIEDQLTLLPDSVVKDERYIYLKSTFDSISTELANNMISFLSSHPNSFVTLYTLYSESYLNYCENHIHKRYLNKKQISKVYQRLSAALKASEKGMKIKKYIDLPEIPRIGDKALDIVQQTPEGDTIKLSDFKGKYVFVDFWASGCGPCRVAFKGLKETYKKYHPLGLEIIAVSGDYRKSDWVNAIKHDAVPWINISDLKGFQNEAFLIYDIKSIPRSILVDKEGIIIYKSDNYGISLDSTLATIFEKERNF